MNIQLYVSKKNFDVQKAERYFKERRIKVQVMDLKKHPLGERELAVMSRGVGLSGLIDREDKRVIYIRPTEKALKIQDKHKAFHQEMVEAVMGLISDQELTILLKALDSVDRYFTQKELEHS